MQGSLTPFNLTHREQGFLEHLREKDRVTWGHAKRVAWLSGELGKRLNLADAKLKDLFQAALFHDIGKLKVSTKALMSESELDEFEWQEMKLHATWGSALGAQMNLSQPVLDAIEAHHERFDGSGYPKSLREHEIPILARIVAVADAFDALTYSRPYRSARSREFALKEVFLASGAQFDPEVVRVLLDQLTTVD